MTFEFKKQNIKNKMYIPVSERIRFLKETAKDYSLTSTYSYFPDRKMWVVQASLSIGANLYTGLAQEIEVDDVKNVNHTSALENAETSAWGRACAAAGIGIDEGVASSDEVIKAVNRGPLVKGTSKNGKDYWAVRHEGKLLFTNEYGYEQLEAKIAKGLSIQDDIENLLKTNK